MLTSASIPVREQIGAAFARPERDKVRALLIDDDPEDAFLLTRLAVKSKQLGIELTTCGSLADGAVALATRQFDVLYVDYWMGLETSVGFIHDHCSCATSLACC